MYLMVALLALFIAETTPESGGRTGLSKGAVAAIATIFTLLVILAVSVGALFLYRRYGPNKKR